MNKSGKSRQISKSLLAVGAVLALGAGLFSTSATAAEAPLNMGSASTYGVLASSAVTSATASTIGGTAGGDLGVGGGTAPTGSITITGTQVLAGSSLTALTAASGALADNRGGTSLGVELGGLTLAPGAYTGGELGITGTLTLNGGGVSSSVFILRAASTLVTAASSAVVLTNGAQACNVFWQVGSSATLGASSTMVGHVIADITITTGATSTVNGQLIARTGAVNLGSSTILNNGCVTPAPTAETSMAVPTPLQESKITSCENSATAYSNEGGPFVIYGQFITPITNISVDGKMISKGLWQQTTTKVTIDMPPRAAGKVNVLLYNGQAPLLSPCAFEYVASPPAAKPVATLYIVKKVVNAFEGTSIESAFDIRVTQNGKEIAGTSGSTAAAPGKGYALVPGTYVLVEDRVEGYRGLWSGPVTPGGTITLKAGDDITVTRTNYDMNPATGLTIIEESQTAATETGGELPDTSSGWANWMLIGGGLIALGAVGFGTRKYISNK